MRPDTPGVFTVAERDRMHARILEIARSDEQIVAGAVVGLGNRRGRPMVRYRFDLRYLPRS